MGILSDLKSFKLRLCHYTEAAPDTYCNDTTKIILAGTLLKGRAGDWYEGPVDPVTCLAPPTLTFDALLVQLSDYFGGGVIIQTLERSLINVRQTDSVSEFVVAFPNITNAFNPGWRDAPLISEFMQNLKEVVRYELTGRGALPITFQAYVAAAIAAESNQAAAHSSRGGHQLQNQPRPAFVPKPISQTP